MVFFFHLFSIIAIFLFNRAELYLIKMVIGFELSDKQKELQKKAREFALNEILPVVNYFDEHPFARKESMIEHKYPKNMEVLIMDYWILQSSLRRLLLQVQEWQLQYLEIVWDKNR